MACLSQTFLVPERFNYYGEVTFLSYNSTCIDNGDNMTYNTWTAGVAFDTDGMPTALDNQEQLCHAWESTRGSGAATANVNIEIYEQSNSVRRQFDFDMQFFNDNPTATSVGFSRCAYDETVFFGSDCDRVDLAAMLLKPLEDEPCKIHTTTVGLNSFSIRVSSRRAWRPTRGRGFDPLDFGVISNEQEIIHVNSTRFVNMRNDLELDYENDWNSELVSNFINSRDVAYTFEITGQAKEVTINTFFANTNFDMIVHLIRINSDGTFEYLHGKDDPTTLGVIMKTLLEPGSYGIVVEGTTTAQGGDFALQVSADPLASRFTPGSIAIAPFQDMQFEYSILPDIFSTSPAAIGQQDIDYNGLNPITYEWAWRNSTQSMFSTISSATGTSLLSSSSRKMLTDFIDFVRFARVGGIEVVTQSVRISRNTGLPANNTCITDGLPTVEVNGLSPASVERTFVINFGSTPSGVAKPSCISIAGFGTGRDIWYKVVVPFSENFSINMEDAAADAGCPNLDWVMSVYQGSCAALSEIACNDDGVAGTRLPFVEINTSTANIEAGEELYIRIWDFNGDDIGCGQLRADDLGCLQSSGKSLLASNTAIWNDPNSWTGPFRTPTFCDDLSISLTGTSVVIDPSHADPIGKGRTLEVAHGTMEVRQGATLIISGN